MLRAWTCVAIAGMALVSHADPSSTATPEELPPIHDCYAPGEPGEGVLPPCDPTQGDGRRRATPDATVTFADEELEILGDAPPWWRFWKRLSLGRPTR